MLTSQFEILERKRQGLPLDEQVLRGIVDGVVDGRWDDAQLGALLMAIAIRGLSEEETGVLTRAMLESGEQWNLANEIPGLVDKHSTGGVGDKVSLILSPLLAACGIPVVMLTGRALGHTGGTADKLESIPGVRLDLDKRRCLELIEQTGLAIGVATASIAPADRRLYALRDRTGTVSSIPLVVGSILSKKLATGAAAIVFDVKTGPGAFFRDLSQGEELCHRLVETTKRLGRRSSGLITDMSQPLGQWVGHSAEVLETYECLEGRGNSRLMEIVFRLCEQAAALVRSPVDRARLASAIDSGEAKARFVQWATAQGADQRFLDRPDFALAPVEAVIESDRHGVLAAVECRRLGELLSRAARDQERRIDPSVSLRYGLELGQLVEPGQEVARLYLRAYDRELVSEVSRCFQIREGGQAPPLVYETVT